MTEISTKDLQLLGQENRPGVMIELIATKGSAPRDSGARMLVYADNLYGTIGGGRAEWIAVNRAREMLAVDRITKREDITLGPAIDQCCGGTLVVEFTKIDSQMLIQLTEEISKELLTNVYIFGAGHTGKALATALRPLPLATKLIDTRPVIGSAKVSDEVEITALPEAVVRGAEPNSIFVILTHDHSLDFLITAEALARGDAQYVGMIGSKTKRAAFESWLGKNDYAQDLFGNLTCPIGGNEVNDKRPAVIAAMTAAQIMSVVSPS